MPNSLILLSLAGLFSGLQQLTSKHLTRSKHSSDSYSTASLMISTLLSIPLLLIQFQLPQNSTTWIIIFFSVIAFAFSTAFGFAAYKHSDVSSVSLLQRSGIVFTYILGIFFLHETLTTKNLAGLILITLGSLSIIYQKNSLSTTTKGTIYALLMAITGAIASVLDKQVLADFSPYTYVFINNLLVSLVFIPRKNNLSQAIQLIRTQPKSLLLRSLLANTSFILILIALQQGAVSSIMPIYKSISLIVPVILGIIFFKESKSITQKLIGLLLSTLGIFLMY